MALARGTAGTFQSGSGSNPTINLPTNSAGDFMVLIFASGDNNSHAVSGWTEVGTSQSARTDHRVSCWVKRSTGGETTASVTYTRGAGGGWCAQPVTYTGGHSTQIITGTPGTGNGISTSSSAGSTTPGFNNSMIVLVTSDSDKAAWSSQANTDPGTLSEWVDNADATFSNCSIALADGLQTTAGATGAGTASKSRGSDPWGTFQFALREEPPVFTPVLQGFHWGEDDGSESAYTIQPYPEDAGCWRNHTLAADRPLLLRVLIQETNGTSGAATDDWKLQYRKNGGTWTDVTTTSNDVRVRTTSNLTDGSATTDRMSGGTGTFVAGVQEEGDGIVANHQITANNHTQHVFALDLQNTTLASGDVLEFRIMLDAGSGYTAITSIKTPFCQVTTGPVLRGVATGRNGTFDATIVTTWPTGAAAGDLIVPYGAIDNNTAGSFNAETGWTEEYDNVAQTLLFGLWTGQPDPIGSGQTFTMTGGTSEDDAWTVFMIDGHDPTTPVNAKAINNGSSTAPQGSTITPSAANCLILVAGQHAAADHGAYTNPPTGTLRFGRANDNTSLGTGSNSQTSNFAAASVKPTAAATGTATWSLAGTSDGWQVAMVAIAPEAGQTISVNQTTETDLAQAITAVPGAVSITVNQATETDLAQAITPALSIIIAVNQTTETDLAQPITVVPGNVNIPVTQATETDLAQPITAVPGNVNIAVGQVTETDLAQTITVSQATVVALNQVTETDLAQTITPVVGPVSIAVGQVTETDLAQPITPSLVFTGTVTQVTETDLAQPITPIPGVVVIALNQVTEADLAQPITPLTAFTGTVVQVIETDLAQPITVVTAQTVSVAQVTETDLAQPITPLQGQAVAVGQVTETDLAQPITAVPGAVSIAVGQVTETDLAQPITVGAAIGIAVGQVTETDLAQPITAVPGTVFIAVGQALETDLAQTISVIPGALTIAVGQVTETDLAQAFTVSQATVVAVGQVTETDLAQPFTLFQDLLGFVFPAFETDTAFSISVVGGIPPHEVGTGPYTVEWAQTGLSVPWAQAGLTVTWAEPVHTVVWPQNGLSVVFPSDTITVEA